MYQKRIGSDKTSSISTRFTNKKAQVTLFIILGIVLLLVIALIIALQTEMVSFKTEEIIPTEKGKVENYIVRCMEKVGEEALLKVGAQAGYIEVPKQIANDANLGVKTSPFTVVPYWAYGKNTNIPSLDQIKQRIDNYFEQNVPSCLFSLQPFQETYDLIEKTSLKANTEIVESKVIFNLNWNIEVRTKDGEVVAEIINHVAESPVKLKRVYNTAQRIVEAEMQSLKLEDLTQDLIALEHPDVPVTGVALSCTQKTWDVASVKQTLLELVRVNIGQLKVKGTDFVEFPETLPYYQNHYVWDIGEEFKQEKVGVVFSTSPEYPYAFAVTPLSGTKLKSSQMGGSNLISFLCLQQWKFTYDLVYPVLVRIEDMTTGYNFYTAFTVHLIRNQPSREDIVARPSLALDTVTDEDYCAARKIPITVKTFELIENNEGTHERNDLPNVNLSFTCLRYKCDLGASEFDYGGQGFSGVTTNFPYCVGGILRGTKTNYREAWERVVTTPAKEIELDLVPLYTFPLSQVEIIKHKFNDPTSIAAAIPLAAQETALITLTARKPSDVDPTKPFHKATAVKTKTSDTSLDASQSLQFLARTDFTYELEVMIFRDEHFIGGYKSNWTASWDNLNIANTLTIHTIIKEDAGEEELFGLLTSLEQNSAYITKPELK